MPSDLTPRDAAFDSLLACERHGRPIRESLDSLFAHPGSDPRNRRQAAELAYGAYRHALALDYLVRKHSRRKLRQIDPELLQVLRLGLYELVFVQGTPDFAAVSQAVAQAKKHAGRHAAGFVNAVLRAVQRDLVNPVSPADNPPPRRTLWIDLDKGLLFNSDLWPDPATNLAKHLSAAWAHPVWLVERWLKRYGRDTTQQICQADNLRPTLWLRVNPLRCTVEQLVKELAEIGHEVSIFGNAIELTTGANPGALPGFNEGWFTVQDIAAQHVCDYVPALPGSRILDLCAAPGGKTVAIAQAMQDTGQLVATDVSPEKLELIEQNLQRLDLHCVCTCLADDLTEADFDAVLVDAPCSNTGVLARRVEVRRRLRPKDIASLRQIQRELLVRAAALVRPGGTLVYATCSIEPDENDLQVERFLREVPGFSLRHQSLVLPAATATVTSPAATATGASPAASDASCSPTVGDFQTLLPGRHHDGAYVAVLVRES